MEQLNPYANVFECVVVELPIKNSGAYPERSATWTPVVERFEKKLSLEMEKEVHFRWWKTTIDQIRWGIGQTWQE